MAKKKSEKKKKRDKKGGSVKVDFEGVTTSTLIPEDDYKVKPVFAEKIKAQSSGKPTIQWENEITEGKFSGQKLFYNTSLQPQALWNLRGLLEAMGIEVPDGKMDIDLDDIIDEAPEFGVSVYHDMYDGRKQSKIGDVFPADSVGDSDDDDDGDGDDDTEEIDSNTILEMDKDELDEFVEANDLDVDLDDLSLKKARKVVKKAFEESGDDEGEVYAKSDIKDMDSEELDELVEAEELKIKKKETKKVKDYRKAVIAALDKKDLVE